MLLAGCKKDDTTTAATTTTVTPTGEAVALGTADVALLNLLQVGKQLSAALLDRIVAAPPAGLAGADLELVRAIAAQQRVHRDLLKAAVNATKTTGAATDLSLGSLSTDFTTVDFTQRAAALGAARTLVHTLVAGAAGVLRFTTRPAALTLLGQLISVDARHATALATLLPGAALTDPQDGAADARNRAVTPAVTLAALNPLLAFGSRLLTANFS